MNREQFNAQWQQLRSYILDRWNKLTDEDLRQINGRYDLLISKIQEKYGLSRDDIEEQFRSWKPNLRFENERHDVLSSRRDREEEGSSLGKWLIAAGIPFLFLLGYLGTHYNTPAVNEPDNLNNTTPTMYTRTGNGASINGTASDPSAPTMYTRTPNGTSGELDTTISQNTRKVLFANSQLLNDLKDVRIETSDGVVTIHGSVRTEEQKSLISNIIERVAGVKSVNNKIDVRS